MNPATSLEAAEMRRAIRFNGWLGDLERCLGDGRSGLLRTEPEVSALREPAAIAKKGNQ